jgi:undecaprenyl-diphosphatase
MCGAEDCTRYSFLISIPIIVASFMMELIESGGALGQVNIITLVVAMTMCFVVGLFCIKAMTKLVESRRLTIFAYYLVALSVILVILSFIR